MWHSLCLTNGFTKKDLNNSRLIRVLRNIKSALRVRALLAAAFFTSVLFLSCENDLKTVNEITGKNNLPTESLKDVEIIYSETATVLIKLNAPTLNRFVTRNPYFEFPDGVTVLFYDSLQQVESKLKAGYAIRKEKERVMEARKNVEIVNRKGETINTEKLTWDEKSERIYTRSRVKITTPNEILFGEGFESDQYFDHWIINKPTGTITLKDE